jgi:pimeloyl-ACP methyl ester carboxylesterase
MAQSHLVYIIDQRNHGNSPHHHEHNYDVLSKDLYEFMQIHKIPKALILGHSMGGKTALQFGLNHPEMVEKMIIVDISPLGYEKGNSAEVRFHRSIIGALQGIDEEKIRSREEADHILKQTISSKTIRQFLLKNLKRTVDGKFTWGLNIKALAENMEAIFEGIIQPGKTDPASIPKFPLLFIKGEKSDYLSHDDLDTARQYFPWCEITVIPDSGHWVHAEQPEKFLNAVNGFIDK